MEKSSTAVKAQIVVELTEIALDSELVDFNYICYGNPPIDEAIQRIASVKDRSLTFNELMNVLSLSYRKNSDLVLTIDRLYPHWVDLEAVAARVDNVLTMTPADWKDRLNSVLAEVIVTNGKAVRLSANVDGWEEWNTEIEGSPVAVFNVREDEWTEFNGTFNDDDDSHSGISAEVIYTSGYSREFRVEGSLREFMEMMG